MARSILEGVPMMYRMRIKQPVVRVVDAEHCEQCIGWAACVLFAGCWVLLYVSSILGSFSRVVVTGCCFGGYDWRLGRVVSFMMYVVSNFPNMSLTHSSCQSETALLPNKRLVHFVSQHIGRASFALCSWSVSGSFSRVVVTITTLDTTDSVVSCCVCFPVRVHYTRLDQRATVVLATWET